MQIHFSLLSRFMSQVFGRPQSADARRRRGSLGCPQKNRRFETLEDRCVLSATFGSALNIGGSGPDGVFDLAVDGTGNSYVTGYFSGTVDFDLSRMHAGNADILTVRGDTDAFVAKYAPDDSLLWVRRMGGDAVGTGSNTDVGRAISLDAGGNVYVVGEFQESADFGSTTLVSAGSKDSFVAKFTSSGTVSWAKRSGTTAGEMAHGAGVDAAGNVYALVTSDSGYNILKFRSNGSQTWSVALASTLSASPEMVVSNSGSVYVAGLFHGTMDFDPSSKVRNLTSGPAYDAFVLNLDANGKYKWVTSFASRTVGSSWGYSMANSVALDASGNVLVGGHYKNTVDFNPGSGSTTLDPAGGAFIAKLNSSGSLVWARALVSSNSSYVYAIDVDFLGNVYATGSFTDTIDLNPGVDADVRSSAGQSDFFVTALTSAGNHLWGETFGGAGSDVGFGIAVDDGGMVHLAGYYQDVADFDPSPLANYDLTAPGASSNGFRLRLRQS